MDDLKACPFCGGEAFMRHLYSNYIVDAKHDDNCPMIFLSLPKDTHWVTRMAAEAAWNRRADRKKGKWILKRKLVPLARDTMPLDYENYDEATHSEWKEYYYCSECNYESGEFTGGKFCPGCGLKMEVGG